MSKYDIAFMGKLPPPIGGVTIHSKRLFNYLTNHSELKVRFDCLNKTSNLDENIFCIGDLKVWFFKSIIKGVNAKIYHYQLANYYGLILLYVVSLFNPEVKFGISIHGKGFVDRLLKRRFLGRIIKYILNKFDFIVVGTKGISDQLSTFGISNNIEIIDMFLPPNERDEVKSLPKKVLDILNVPGKNIVVNGYNVDLLSKNTDLYGYHLMSDLSVYLNKQGINFKLIILISEINNQDYLDKLFSNLSNVFIISDPNIYGWKLIKSADLFIRPTSTDGNAISLKEALVFGVPALASDVVDRYEGVYTFSYNDKNDLFQKTIELLELNNSEICDRLKNDSAHLDYYKKILYI